jgi:hypothetical protein
LGVRRQGTGSSIRPSGDRAGRHDIVFSVTGKRLIRDTPSNRRLAAWFAAFPSARATWMSLRTFAKQGVLCMDLPNAKVRGIAAGYGSGDAFDVTRLSIESVAPSEEPYNFASAIEVHEFTLLSAGSRNTTRDSSLLEGANGWEVTDAEWEAVRPLLETRTSRGVRRKLNIALCKQGTGRAWREVEARTEVACWFYDIRYRGVWDEVLAVLLRARQRQPDTQPSMAHVAHAR